jgi:hypothetical protein
MDAGSDEAAPDAPPSSSPEPSARRYRQRHRRRRRKHVRRAWRWWEVVASVAVALFAVLATLFFSHVYSSC